MIERAADEPLELWVENIEDEPIDGRVTLELVGLGARRVVDLGRQTYPAKSKTRLAWSPAESPIQPTGSTARISARVAFERGDVEVNSPARGLLLAFDEGGRAAFVSATEDAGVRLASLGRVAASSERVTVSPEDRALLLARVGDWRGTVDGEPVKWTAPTEPIKDLAEAIENSELFDTVELDDEPIADEGGLSRGVTPNDIIIIPLPACEVGAITIPVCARWNPQNFRDINASSSSSVPNEDYDLSGPAAYANATIYDGWNVAWQGRLDANGCSPPATFCVNRAQISVSAASLQVPDTYMVPGGNVYGTREFVILPARSYSSTILPVYDPVVWIKGIATVSSVFPPMKVAAAASRILTMPDNGVRRNALGYTAPALTIHAQDGCPSIPYGSGKYGEACAQANEAWFGWSLRQIGGNANNPVYEETGWHTTDDAYTIGHELGHSMQFAASGGPGTFDYSVVGEDMCSCDHVYDGNRIHCLQSSHRQDTAEIEGFGHFYAARVMNDQASTCRFTYYKNYRKVTDWSDPKNNNDSIYPPVPVDCGQPFEGFPGTPEQKQGWVPSFCPESNTSSENDWLTFLWAVNGSAATSQRSSMNDLFTILGGSGTGTGFTWTSVKNKATSHFASNPTKRNRFTDSGELHGVDQ